MAAETDYDAILAQLSLHEKCLLLSGQNMWETLDVSHTTPPLRPLKFTDGPAGVRGATWVSGTHTTFIPCGISLGATFSPDLVERVGRILGAEARSKNAHVLLAPTMNLCRTPLGGRNFETFGEDPLLAGVLSKAYISGVQSQGVGACMKHFVANDTETRRFNVDQKISMRTLREVYLRPFEIGLQADPWTAMTAYPKVNGAHLDCSSELVGDILRGEWAFDGLVMSDWGGLNDTQLSIAAGTDLEMPGPPIRYGAALEAAVNSGSVSEEVVDASVKRLLKLLDRAGLLSGADGAGSSGEGASDLPEFRATAREAATSSIVLLKNDTPQGSSAPLLPLKPQTLKKLAIIGPNAKKPTAGGTGSAAVNPYYITTPLESLTSAAQEVNPALEVVYEQGIVATLQPGLAGALLRTPDNASQGLLVEFFAGHTFSGPVVGSSKWDNSLLFMMSDGDVPVSLRGNPHCFRASGVLTPAVDGEHELSFSSTGKAKVFVNGELVIDNSAWTVPGGTFMNCGSINQTVKLSLSKGMQYAIRIDNLAVPPPLPPHDNTLFHTVSGMRLGIAPVIDEEALFAAAVSAASAADAVVVVIGHNNDTEKEGIDRTSLTLPRHTDDLVSAVRAANPHTVVVVQSACAVSMPWVEPCAAIVQAWYQGQENGNALADILLGAATPSGKLPITFPRALADHGAMRWFPGNAHRDESEYGEGVLIGYRWFEKTHGSPLWPFGFGLSYTTFAVTQAALHGRITADGGTATVTARVTNTGAVRGAEVLQLYVASSPHIEAAGGVAARRSLAAFAKTHVEPGESSMVSLQVGSEAVRWFDEKKGGWRVDPGAYQMWLATSSRLCDVIADILVVVE